MSIRVLACHLSLAVLILTAFPSAAISQPPDATGGTTFVVLFRGSRVGTETVTLSKTPTGWVISSSGQLLAPVDLTTRRFEISYGNDWQPQKMVIDGVLNGLPVGLSTTFGLTTAVSDFAQGPRQGSATHEVSPRTVVLPANQFGSYEALAARLATLDLGARIPIYIAPEFEVGAVVDRVTPRRIALPNSTVAIREYVLTVTGPNGPVPLEIWADESNRLARLVLPALSVVVVRDDLASVMAREERTRNPGDEDAFIGAAGFSLGATFTRQATSQKTAPAIVLVSAPGAQERDHMTYGVSIFGQLAGALASRGYFVVRYDGRGTGRSGGRTENAEYDEYAGDLLRIISWLRRRDEVDDNRIAVVSYGDSAPVALLAARRESRIRAVALLAAPGRSGREVTLEQQARLLASLNTPEAERGAKIAMQEQIIDATLTGEGWEGISAGVRRQAESGWFKSWLEFDPATTLTRLNQPILILHGTLDTEFPPSHADRLEEIASARKVPPIRTRKVLVEGVNHLLVPAETGSTSEYQFLKDLTISPQVPDAIAAWLNDVLPPR